MDMEMAADQDIWDFSGFEMDPTPESQARGVRALHMLQEFKREAQLKAEAEAKELGFSSWEQYERRSKERSRLNIESYTRHLDEKCARLGITRGQLYDMDPQRFIPDSWSPECDCDCELLPEDLTLLTIQ
jgi:hypothetical protein